MRFLKPAFAAALLLLATPALAGNTILFSSQLGDITFPFTAPTTSPSAAGLIDNMTIGATTPRAGNFTTLTSTSAPSGAGITALFASPPAIGGTASAAGKFTNLTAANLLFTGTAPVPTGTGTPTIATGSTNGAGEVTAGASATSVIITFNGAPLTNPPFCVVRTQAQVASFAYTISASAITVTQTATSGNLIDYICVQH